MKCRLDLGAPVGGPAYKVVPYGSGGNGHGAWDESDSEGSEDMDEDVVPIVSNISQVNYLHSTFHCHGGLHH